LVLTGMSPQEALQKTQLKFIVDNTIQDPFFWAAFTVVGI
jgi:CHAT domain-containing protein